MQIRFLTVFSVLVFSLGFSQKKISRFSWLRSGLIVGYASQNTYIKQDSDYAYNSRIIKFSNHFNFYRNKKNSFEILIEPSYYKSQHQLLNYFFLDPSTENVDQLRSDYMKSKNINEYVLNLGIVYRYMLGNDTSVFAVLNTGPMYIDTETERLKKGFAFSDVFGLGFNYRYKKVSFDVKCMVRHVSNANLQSPNSGLNSVGFEVGSFIELN